MKNLLTILVGVAILATSLGQTVNALGGNLPAVKYIGDNYTELSETLQNGVGNCYISTATQTPWSPRAFGNELSSCWAVDKIISAIHAGVISGKNIIPNQTVMSQNGSPVAYSNDGYNIRSTKGYQKLNNGTVYTTKYFDSKGYISNYEFAVMITKAFPALTLQETAGDGSPRYEYFLKKILGVYVNMDEPITRENAVYILLRAAGITFSDSQSNLYNTQTNGTKVNAFSDYTKQDHGTYSIYIKFANDTKLISGKTKTINGTSYSIFAPNDNISREEFVQIAMKTLGNYEDGTLSKAKNILISNIGYKESQTSQSKITQTINGIVYGANANSEQIAANSANGNQQISQFVSSDGTLNFKNGTVINSLKDKILAGYDQDIPKIGGNNPKNSILNYSAAKYYSTSIELSGQDTSKQIQILIFSTRYYVGSKFEFEKILETMRITAGQTNTGAATIKTRPLTYNEILYLGQAQMGGNTAYSLLSTLESIYTNLPNYSILY